MNELSTTEKTWIIVFFHKPFFTTGGHANDMNSYRDTWWKAFDDYGVDVVLNGHTHSYLRSKPINLNISNSSPVGEYGSDSGQGRLQIVAGSYGAPLSPTGSGWFIGKNLSTMNYTKFDINDNVLTMNAYDMSGSLIDNVSIIKEDGTIPPADTTPPATPSNFAATVGEGIITLSWNSNTESDLAGYDLYRGMANGEWKDYLIGVDKFTTTYVDSDISANTTYYYQISARDGSGNKSDRSNQINATSLNTISNKISIEFSLNQNIPNPFNSNTLIEYSIPNDSNVNIIIYDLMGNEVKTLFNKYKQLGQYTVTWNSTDNSGQTVVCGIYFYQLQSGDFSETRKMVLLK